MDTSHNSQHKRRNIPTPVASPTAPPQLIPTNTIKRTRGSNNNQQTNNISTTTTTSTNLSSSTIGNITNSSNTNPIINYTSLFDPLYTNTYLSSSLSTSPIRVQNPTGISSSTKKSISQSKSINKQHPESLASTAPTTTTTTLSSNTNLSGTNTTTTNITSSTTTTNTATTTTSSTNAKGKPRVSYAGLKAYGGIGALYWTDEEDTLLKNAVEQIGDTDWTAVAKLVPRRTAQQCLSRWTKALKAGTARGEWTLQEDNAIRAAVAAAPNGILSVVWTEVAQGLPGRIGKQCRERWLFHLDRKYYVKEEGNLKCLYSQCIILT